MPSVKWMNEQENPDWTSIVAAIHDLPNHDDDRYVTVNVDDDSWFVVYYVPNLGYYLSGCGIGERDYFTLTCPPEGRDPVRVWMAGEHITRPRKAFVPETVALQALRHYFDTGQKDSSLAWERENDLGKE
jgi:hypothetical protein